MRQLPWFMTAASLAAALLSAAYAIAAGPNDLPEPARVLEPRFIHLRNDPAREWSSFPQQPGADHLEVRFKGIENKGELSLRLRQQDVKQPWHVLLNGQRLGTLVREEADLVVYFPVPAGSLLTGENVLRIESPARGAKLADDIRVGQLRLEHRPLREVLNEATLEIDVIDQQSKQPLPARITIADNHGARHETGAVSSDELAARPGVVYTASGKARFGMPAGEYTIYASRGFEYSLAQVQVALVAGQTATHTLAIRREVPTPGYVACDTHIHTLTHSGHGDASLAERMITLAGEGIELPIATDHNVHIDYEQPAQRLGMRSHFTPVTGNEVTTSVGHFNIFPVASGAPLPNHRHKEWVHIFDAIFATPGVQVAILNHARDLHSGVRPFGPQLFNAAIGDNIAGWPMRFNAMEIINSGATQTDPLRLPHDWMALLNRGYTVTPVGSSDSHDVARYIVGQGRTYIRCDDRDVSQLDVTAAVENFKRGRVSVSYGLLTHVSIDNKYHPGDLATISGDLVPVHIRVLAPHWAAPSRVQLYVNGQLHREEAIVARPAAPESPGLQWSATWNILRPQHDVHLVAIALGKGIDSPHWATAKPYQPTSPAWEPYSMGVSGAVWLDGDDDGRQSAARHYAERAIAAAGDDFPKLLAALAPYDAAVASQAAHLYRTSGKSLAGQEFSDALKSATAAVQDGFRAYAQAWRENEISRRE